MAKRKTTRPDPLPIRTNEQIKEDESRILLEQAIKPWMISAWTQRDFGIDAIVEIMKSIPSSKNQVVTGKRFSVQVKSSDTASFDKKSFSLSIPIEKINYWYQAIEPVLIVYVDLVNKTCYYRWVNEAFIQELFTSKPNWISQQSVSIQFSKDKFLSPKTLSEIEKFALNWKRPAKKILAPGNYFKFSREAKSFIDTFIYLLEKHQINQLPQEVEDLKIISEQSIYTVAIVGPTKAGKSTLINCLLEKTISPVGMLPTTGVPITIFPGRENKAVVFFKDGTEIVGEVSDSFLKEYTSKKDNPDNIKNVKLVSVYIINHLLEKGFAICDVPGLDDPDEVIRAITKTALYNVNAIIYLVSVGPMSSGDFSIDKQIIEDLIDLSGRMDRLFLVFNKTDVLNQELIDYLKGYVNETLHKFDILKYLPFEPLYISSQESLENRLHGADKKDSVKKLEGPLWEHLLANNKIGLNKIIGTYSDLSDIIEKHKKIITIRLIDTKRRDELQNEINTIRGEIEELRALVINGRQEIQVALQTTIENQFESVLRYLEQDLSQRPVMEQLPENKQITSWLENRVYSILSNVYNALQQDIYELQSTVNQWVSEKLRQIEIVIEDSTDTTTFRMSEISKYTNQITNYFKSVNNGPQGLIEKILYTIGKALFDLFDWISEAFISDETKRKTLINEIIANTSRSFNSISTEYLFNVNQYLSIACRQIEEKSIDRANVYLHQLSNQVDKLGVPLSFEEQNNFKIFLTDIENIEVSMKSNILHLKDYASGIDW